MKLDFVIGAVSWKKSWSLPLFFESVRANVDPAKTGLAFVVPAQDTATREMIRAHSEGFAWVEIQRDKTVPFDPEKVGTHYHHRAMASAKNWIISQAIKTRPRYFIYWDTDLLVPELTVANAVSENRPLVGIWAWLNRQQPKRHQRTNPETGEKEWVLWEPPMQATAMQWDDTDYKKAWHFPAKEWEIRASTTWQADVVLGFQVMKPEVYNSCIYREHVDGEDIPFMADMQRRGLPRWVMGQFIGVHLYEHITDECEGAWEDVIVNLAEQWPLAAMNEETRDPEAELLGFYPER